jgi:hypothetical protein
MRGIVTRPTISAALLILWISGALLLAVLALARPALPVGLVFSRFEGEEGRFVVYVDAGSGAALARRTPVQASDVAAMPFDPEPRSPDGTQVVLPRITRDGVDLFIADAAGTLTQLTDLKTFPPGPRSDWQMRSNTYPLWSPDGRWISFLSAGTDARLDLYRVRPDGTGLRMLYASVTTPTPLNLRWVALPDPAFPAWLLLGMWLLAGVVLAAWWLRDRRAG